MLSHAMESSREELAFSTTNLEFLKPVGEMFEVGAETSGVESDAYWSPFTGDWFHFLTSMRVYVFLRSTF